MYNNIIVISDFKLTTEQMCAKLVIFQDGSHYALALRIITEQQNTTFLIFFFSKE